MFYHTDFSLRHRCGSAPHECAGRCACGRLWLRQCCTACVRGPERLPAREHAGLSVCLAVGVCVRACACACVCASTHVCTHRPVRRAHLSPGSFCCLPSGDGRALCLGQRVATATPCARTRVLTCHAAAARLAAPFALPIATPRGRWDDARLLSLQDAAACERRALRVGRRPIAALLRQRRRLAHVVRHGQDGGRRALVRAAAARAEGPFTPAAPAPSAVFLRRQSLRTSAGPGRGRVRHNICCSRQGRPLRDRHVARAHPGHERACVVVDGHAHSGTVARRSGAIGRDGANECCWRVLRFGKAAVSGSRGITGTSLAAAGRWRCRLGQLWDPATSEKKNTLRGHRKGVTSLGYSDEYR
jgi:hypothetical protein